MRNFLTKYKSALILLILILIGFWLYTLFFPKVKNALQEGPVPVGQELFTTLNTIQTLELNTAIFSNNDYLKLQNQETEIGSQRSGRSNPFSATGNDAGGTLRESSYKKIVPTVETFLRAGTTTPTNVATSTESTGTTTATQ